MYARGRQPSVEWTVGLVMQYLASIETRQKCGNFAIGPYHGMVVRSLVDWAVSNKRACVDDWGLYNATSDGPQQIRSVCIEDFRDTLLRPRKNNASKMSEALSEMGSQQEEQEGFSRAS
ncbi:uncharacterized protein N7446_007615 [Penicillium canescens]|uniref:uncharacterized protein n=1 Tax=Penicillium canescens TaxID=5083 RepID=UPI0026DF390A|nr:uncharacterized protein N7446_007615 [Penicillium canescens]KAJ6063495.1 hypothetical protein N7446_007615 [Penicillium canescens]